MKRTILLLTILAVFSMLSLEPAVASSPVINGRTASVSGWLAFQIAVFLRAHANNAADLQPICCFDDRGPMLGGDADDYANGKTPDQTTSGKFIYVVDGSQINDPILGMERE